MALSFSATIFADQDGYGGTRFEGFTVSRLLGRHLGNVSLSSLIDGTLRGEDWTGPSRHIPLEPLAKRRWLFWRLTVGDQLAKIIETSHQAPLLRDILEQAELAIE